MGYMGMRMQGMGGSQRVILEIPVRYLDYVAQLQEIAIESSNDEPDSLVFGRGRTREIPDEALQDLREYTVADLFEGYLWQIKESPEDIGFCFYQNRKKCLYLSNVPYLVIHHAPSGYAWGYMGSGPSDLGFNLAEYFARKHYRNLKQTEVWRGQASLLAYRTHYAIRDLVNELLRDKWDNPTYIAFSDLAAPVLKILDNVYSNDLDFFQEGAGELFIE